MNNNNEQDQDQVQNNDDHPAPNQNANTDGQFFVRTLTGNTLVFSHSPTMTVLALKQEIQNKQQVPVDQQRLVFQGKQLDDTLKLSDYGIYNDATIHLVLRLR